MASKTILDIKHDQRGTIEYDRETKDFMVYAPDGQWIGFVATLAAAHEALNAWHYDNAKRAA